MADLYSKIAVLRDSLDAVNQDIKRAYGELIGGAMICKCGTALNSMRDAMILPMKNVDTALCAAHNAAALMVEVKKTKTVSKYIILQFQGKNHGIVIDYDRISADLDVLKKGKTKLADAKATCTKLIKEADGAQFRTTKNAHTAAVVGSAAEHVIGGAGGLSNLIQKGMQAMPPKADLWEEAAKGKKFQQQKGVVVENLTKAKNALTMETQQLDRVIALINAAIASFRAADNTMRKKFSEIRAAKALEQSKKYTKITSANKNEAKAARQELAAAQAEYKAAHGVESKELKEEIERLDKQLYGRLKAVADIRAAFIAQLGKAKGDWMEQHSAAYSGYTGMCCAVSYAVGLYLVTGKAYDPKKFAKKNGWTSYKEGHISDKVNFKGQNSLKDIYNNIEKGLPSMIHYDPPGHFVTVIGIRPGANPNALKVTDLLVFNPAGAKEQYLSASTKIDHYRRFTK